MQPGIRIRPIARQDHAEWRVLWDGYNAFYGREGPTALPEAITQTTWERFFDDSEPVHAFVAEQDGQLIGLVHYLFHRSTTRLNDVCYLQDLFNARHLRGRGAGRLLIQAVYDAAKARDSSRVYWMTDTANATARVLYDKLAQHLGTIVYVHEL
ncbi:MAG: GNAT family N-acetyltransferase [Acidovorax sp.]|uniref:GNAT family N-acetyltransferase n=1 Tax=Acidovorax sp. TaxID=1872122 RepID=UPI0039E2DBD9